MLKETFQTEDANGNSITLAIQAPNAYVKNKAKIQYAKAWNDALDGGVMLIAKLDSHLREQNIWDDIREAEYVRLVEALRSGEDKLRGGNIKLGEAKAVALQMASDRADLSALLSVRQEIEANTAEKLAETVQFNYLVAHCTVYNDNGKPYFSEDGKTASVDNYIQRGTEVAAIAAATKCAEMFYGTDTDFIAKLPENAFLKQYGFVNENYQLINKDKKLVDEQGRLIDENGRYINEAGEFVNAAGQRVDETGRPVIEFKPFLDDETGEPVPVLTRHKFDDVGEHDRPLLTPEDGFPAPIE